MTKPGPAKMIATTRLSPPGRDWIVKRAKEEGVTLSEMIRIMLRYASANMPKGWR